MHNKIIKHLLSLFFVLVLLTIMGLPWAVEENSPSMKEAAMKENENFRFQMPKYPQSSEKPHLEVKIY